MNNNEKIYLVGGAVRDHLMGLVPKDRDYVVVGGSRESMLAKGFECVGADFPVFIHPETREEYALARTERKSGVGYQGFECNTESVTIEDDLARRDFTMNAIAQDENGTIIDPFNGVEDIKKGVLRHVSEAFREDPVRILRAARFVARCGFTVAPETMDFMIDMVSSGEADHLTPERIWKEFERGIGEHEPQLFIATLRDCGFLKRIMPELLEPNVYEFLKNYRGLYRPKSFSCWGTMCGAITTDAVTNLSKVMTIPTDYLDLGKTVAKYRNMIISYSGADADTRLYVIEGINKGIKRHRHEFAMAVIDSCVTSVHEKDFHKLSFIRYLIEHDMQSMYDINAQTVDIQGLTGQAIGKAIRKARLDWLRNN